MIPYERQIQRPGERTCGAAVLSMLYRSFGVSVNQVTVWEELRQYSSDRTRARTCHLTRHLLEHGFSAVAARLREPETFVFGDFPSVRMIVVHRIRRESDKGHFSLFVGVDRDRRTVFLHDPQVGPHREIDVGELLELWTPPSPGCEITRNIVVIVSAAQSGPTECRKCSRTFFDEPLRSFAATAFETLFCPWCDGRVEASF